MHTRSVFAAVAASFLVACGGSAPEPSRGAPTNPSTSDPLPDAPKIGRWSNIGGGIGYGLQLVGDRGTLVECETGGHCSVYAVETVRWSGTDLEMTVRFPDSPQVWKAARGEDGMLRIVGGIWRAQTLYDCEHGTSAERALPYLCPDPLPLTSGATAGGPAAGGPAPVYSGQLRPGPGAPDWRPVAAWPEGVAGMLWGQEANGGDACAPVLEPPPDAGHGWSRFWVWRVYARDELVEYSILHRILVWNGETTSDLSVVKRRSLAVWTAGSPRLASTFLTYEPPAPRDIHSRFKVHTLMPPTEGRRELQSRGLIDRLGDEMDFSYAIERHRKGSPIEASESADVGIGPPEGTESACRPEELGVLAPARYRMRDVARGTDEYGLMGELLTRLVGR